MPQELNQIGPTRNTSLKSAANLKMVQQLQILQSEIRNYATLFRNIQYKYSI